MLHRHGHGQLATYEAAHWLPNWERTRLLRLLLVPGHSQYDVARTIRVVLYGRVRVLMLLVVALWRRGPPWPPVQAQLYCV